MRRQARRPWAGMPRMRGIASPPPARIRPILQLASMDYASTLPREVLVKILGGVAPPNPHSVRDLCAAASVCPSWRDAAAEPCLWCELYVNEAPLNERLTGLRLRNLVAAKREREYEGHVLSARTRSNEEQRREEVDSRRRDSYRCILLQTTRFGSHDKARYMRLPGCHKCLAPRTFVLQSVSLCAPQTAGRVSQNRQRMLLLPWLGAPCTDPLTPARGAACLSEVHTTTGAAVAGRGALEAARRAPHLCCC